MYGVSPAPALAAAALAPVPAGGGGGKQQQQHRPQHRHRRDRTREFLALRLDAVIRPRASRRRAWTVLPPVLAPAPGAKITNLIDQAFKTTARA